MSLGERLKKARKDKGVTQTELAECVGVSQAAIAGLELRKGNKSGFTSQIADCLEINVQWLATGTGQMEKPEPTPVTQIPVIRWTDIHCWQDAEPVRWIPWHKRESTVSEVFALEISGVSMEPEFGDGDHIVIDPDKEPSHNDFVIIEVADEYPILRQFIIEGGRTFARALNPDWTPRLEPIESDVCGVVIQKSRNY
jgi:SOS-response transcriptional repressor LexA